MLALDGLVVAHKVGETWREVGSTFAIHAPLSFRNFGVGRVDALEHNATAKYDEINHACYLSTAGAASSPQLHGRPSIPRPVRSLDPRNSTYRSIVQSYLDRRGVKGAVARITKIVQADLDGDGTYEVIIEARSREGLNHIPPTEGWKGSDYSLVLLRFIKGRSVTEVPLEFTVIAKNAMELNRIRGVADLDGDGRMEIVTDGKGYEWHQAALWGYRSGSVRLLTSTYSGQ